MQAFFNAATRRLVGPALAALGLLAACGPDHDLDCLRSNGPVTVQRRAIDRHLAAVFLFEHVDLVIVPDTAVYAEVRAGENNQSDITFTTNSAHQLSIHNTSRCNWTRSYDTPREVRLHLPYLRRVEQRGYGLVSNEGQWAQDTLFARIQSTGDVRLNVRTTYLYVDDFDAGDFTLSGQTHDLLVTTGSNGFVFAAGVQASNCYFHSSGTWVGDVHLRASQILGGVVNGSGTVYYSGTPALLDFKGPNTRVRQE